MDLVHARHGDLDRLADLWAGALRGGLPAQGIEFTRTRCFGVQHRRRPLQVARVDVDVASRVGGEGTPRRLICASEWMPASASHSRIMSASSPPEALVRILSSSVIPSRA